MATKRRPATRKGKPARRTTARATPRRATARRATPRATPARKTTAGPRMVVGAIQHIELYTDDVEATKNFHAEVFDWKFENMSYGPGMQYTMFRTPGTPTTIGGGVMSRQQVPAQLPPVLAYVNVTSVEDTVRKVERAGGKVLLPRMEVPNVGWFAVFMDPGGVVEAVWEQNPSFRPQ